MNKIEAEWNENYEKIKPEILEVIRIRFIHANTSFYHSTIKEIKMDLAFNCYICVETEQLWSFLDKMIEEGLIDSETCFRCSK